METILFKLSLTKWEILAAIGVIFMILEVFIPGFVLLPVGIAFIIAAIAAIWIKSWIGVLVVLALSLLLVISIFQKFIKGFNSKNAAFTNVEGMIGKECEVIEDISPEKPGYVKLYGDEWRAKPTRGNSFSNGDRAIISKLDGNTVFVEPIN